MSLDSIQETTADSPVDDSAIVEYLRRRGAASISELVDFAGVTATAVRQRLSRLMDNGLVVRRTEVAGRGRPSHRYSLSKAGARSSGNNYEDLATALWAEIRAIKDPTIRQGLLKRLVARLAEIYRDKIEGTTPAERMESLVRLMQDRNLAFEVNEPEDGQLPVLTAMACPYPDLAEQDRSICAVEKMLFAEILGESLRLSNCRLDGALHCTFDMNGAVTAST